MSDADLFRKKADESRQMAADATGQGDKAFWLHLAEDWMKLAEEVDNDPESSDPGISSRSSEHAVIRGCLPVAPAGETTKE